MSEGKVDRVTQHLASWDRLLLIISLPHGAAFGAFLGKYDFEASAKSTTIAFHVAVGFILLLPATSIWLFYVHDSLRNTFLRVGHGGFWLKIKHNVIYYLTGIYPLGLFLIAIFYEGFLDSKTVTLISATMFSWQVCAIVSANSLYLRLAKELGFEPSD